MYTIKFNFLPPVPRVTFTNSDGLGYSFEKNFFKFSWILPWFPCFLVEPDFWSLKNSFPSSSLSSFLSHFSILNTFSIKWENLPPQFQYLAWGHPLYTQAWHFEIWHIFILSFQWSIYKYFPASCGLLTFKMLSFNFPPH